MLNKITEPQAIYSKAPTPGQPAHSSFTTSPSNKKGKLNWKIAGSIFAVCLVAVVGVAGVLIAQRQQADQSPVAPNAPESRPAAAVPESTACSISFEVKKPTTTPTPGAAKCISKTATLVGSTVPLTANSKVAPGSVIEYTITVGPSGSTNSTISISDTLPPELEYKANSATLNGTNTSRTFTPTGTARLLQYDLTGASANKQNVIKYQATLKTNTPATVTSFTNAVKVVTNPSSTNPTTDTSCKLTLGVQPPASGVASCVSKIAYKGDTTTAFGTGATPALAKRGEVIRYQITIKANALTSGPVEIKDVLPDALTYQEGSARIGTQTPSAAQFTRSGQTLTFKPGVMASTAANREIVFTYKASVKADAQVAPFKNTVSVSTNGVTAAPVAACVANLQVAPVGVAACQTKEAFTDYNGTKIANDSVLPKGTEFVYKLSVAATETTAGEVVVVDTLPSKLEFVESKDNTLQHNGGRLTATLPQFGTTAEDRIKTFEYKVKVKDDAGPGKFENSVTVTTANNTAQADSCKLTLHVPYQCDSDCTTDAQCNNNGSSTSYICSAEAGNKCRRASNPDSASCSSTEKEYSCNSSCTSDSQCQQENSNYICAPTSEGDRCRHKEYPTRPSCDAVSTPTPTPAIGCNDSCVTNADCSNPSHICYNDGGTQVCRLETNPASVSCNNPGTPTTPGQPELPQELPQTGPEDWVNWLKAGLITLGVGAVLLLLL